jgi:hypothetical protein
MGRQNVLEPWSIYDSICICRNFYGNESSVQGWFLTFAAFAAQQEHRFFKSRNEAICGLPYNNMQSQDRADFAFHALSIGISFQGPCQGWEKEPESEFMGGGLNISNFFQFDLPNHVGIEFRLAQDVRLDANPYHIPPGYGPRVSGVSQGIDLIAGATNAGYSSGIVVGTQGEPVKDNRFYFKSEIAIPRNETFEVRMTLSEYARNILSVTNGPANYFWGYPVALEAPHIEEARFPTRYVIQCAIHGLREVQQRGQLSV